MIENINRWVRRIYIGATNSPGKFAATVFLSYSAGWVIIEPIIALVPDAKENIEGTNRFAVLVFLSLIVALRLVARPIEISFEFQNNQVVIKFGDLFQQTGVRVIPVSRYMHETEVVPKCLQGVVIREFFNSAGGTTGIDAYNEKLDAALKAKEHNTLERKAERGPEKQYPLGTLALIDHLGKKYLLLAMTETELVGEIPDNNCSGTNLWIALDSLWKESPGLLHGENINIPLLGSGVAGIRLSRNHLLAINILALLNAISYEGKITTGEIRIIIHSKYFNEIDLSDFKQRWIHS
jgi:hypothetical protein